MTKTQTFTAHAAALKRALAFASQPIERRNTVPIIGMVLIECDGEAITVTGTDLDLECRAGAAAIDGSDALSFTISPRLLADLLRWAEGTITISRNGDILTITADDVTATVRELCPAEDWPNFFMGDPVGLPIAISEAKLHKALGAVQVCVSKEETRYYLNGVYMHDAGKGLRCVATDGHRMAIYDTGVGWGLPDAIMPRKTVSILHRSVNVGGNQPVTVRAVHGAKAESLAKSKEIMPRFEFSGDGWRIRSRVIDGTFPDYKRVLPSGEVRLRATISAAALRRFPATGERSRLIKIDPSNGCMSYSNNDGITVSMPVHGEGDAFGFNMKYLRAFADRAGTIRIEGSGQGDPFWVLTDDPALQQVMMPMRV